MSSLRVITAPVCWILLAAAACTGPAPFREGVRLTDRSYPGAVLLTDGVFVLRLVSDLSGAPVAGAEVFLIDESKTPIAGEFWFTSRTTSDAEGFARITLPAGARGTGWQMVRHPQFGIAMRSGGDSVWRLGPAFDVPVRITDWFGRPSAGARIGFCGGCGHTPDLVNATADANGIAVLRGIDPQNSIADLYVQHPGLHFFYDSVDWLPGAPPMEVQCDYAPALRGRLLDHRGEPVAGAFVCGGEKHRGPWGRTAADGSFVVLGAAPPTYPHHVVTASGREAWFDSSAGGPVTLRLPDFADPKAHEGTVDAGPEPAPDIACRDVRVDVVGAPGRVHFGTVAPGSADREPPAAGCARVPVQGPFVLVAFLSDTESRIVRSFPFADGARVREPIVVQWEPDVRISGRVVDPAGQPLAADVRIRGRWSKDDPYRERDEVPPLACPDGVFDLPCAHTGTVLLEITPHAKDRRGRGVWVAVPPRGSGERVDLGAVVAGAAAALRVVDADGASAPRALVSFARPGWQEAGSSFRWPLDDGGGWLGPDLRAGDSIVVQADDAALPTRCVLQGEGPWTIAVPAGRLALEIVDESGQALDAVVVCGDQDIDVEAGKADLRGLPLGPVRLFVGARGRRAAVVDAVVGSVGRTVSVVLPRREGT